MACAFAVSPQKCSGLRLAGVGPRDRTWRAEKLNVLGDVLIVIIADGLFQRNSCQARTVHRSRPAAALLPWLAPVSRCAAAAVPLVPISLCANYGGSRCNAKGLAMRAAKDQTSGNSSRALGSCVLDRQRIGASGTRRDVDCSMGRSVSRLTRTVVDSSVASMSTAARPSAFAWYWNRLRCMSAPELLHRVQQKASAQLEKLGIGTATAIPPHDLSSEARGLLGVAGDISAEPYRAAANEILSGRLKVFGLDYECGVVPQWNRDPKTGTVAPLKFGKTLNYRDESLVGDIKYLWEPNRHLHLVTLAQGYRLTQDQKYLDGLRQQLESWFEQCPYLLGPNWSSSLELGIRLINWSIVWQLIGEASSPAFADTDGKSFRDRWLRSIYQNMHFIRGHFSRYSSANNHLIGEAAGLFVGAVTWPYWGQCRPWADTAQRILERETLLQNAPDGVNREQAVSYQQFVLDFLLISALAGRANGREFSPAYWQRMEVMLEYLASIMDVGAHVPMIGDADDGYAVRLSQEPDFCPYRSLLATGAVLFRRSEFAAKAGRLDDKTRWLLGSSAQRDFEALRSQPSTLPVRRAFPDGGYYILGCDFETDREIRAIVDAGPLGYLSIAAHGHADALALTLSVGGREFLIDPGTYAYHTHKRWRDYFRSTAAHNTVVVDGQNQSEIGGNFMWLRKANARCERWETNSHSDEFVGSHDGYAHLADPVRHRREIRFDKGTRHFVVTDTLDCRGLHRVECFWHFAEDCEVACDGDTLTASNSGRTIHMSMRSPKASFEIRRGQLEPPCGWVSRSFDVKVAAVAARVAFDIRGTTSIVTEIVCD